MSHELEVVDGKASMAFFGKTPWHGLGTEVHGLMTASEALTAAGLDWTVALEPTYTRHGVIPGRFAVTRQSDNPAKDGTTFGIVGKDYKPIQNIDGFTFFDHLVDSGEAKYETAGSLAGGRRVWLTAKVGETMQVCGEDTDCYLLFSNSHDGSRAFNAVVTYVRVVCANTETMAIRGAKTSWSINHKQTLEGKVAEARKSLELTFKGQDAFQAEVEKLMGIKVSTDQFREIMTAVLPKQKRQLEKNLDTLTGLFENEATIVDTDAKGNAWGAYNAVTYWADHKREVRSLDARFTSLMPGGFGYKTRNATRDRLLALA